MSAKKQSANQSATPPAFDPSELASQAMRANLANIIRKVKAGSTLTASETRTLAETRRKDEERASEYIRRGTAVMVQIREIIESSALPKTLQRQIIEKIAEIKP